MHSWSNLNQLMSFSCFYLYYKMVIPVDDPRFTFTDGVWGPHSIGTNLLRMFRVISFLAIYRDYVPSHIVCSLVLDFTVGDYQRNAMIFC